MSGRRERKGKTVRVCSVHIAYGSVVAEVSPGKRKRRRRTMLGLKESLYFPMLQSRTW